MSFNPSRSILYHFILMAQTMWNHGPEMLERLRKANVLWQKIEGKELVDFMKYLNQGMP